MIYVGDRVHSTRHEAAFIVEKIEIEQHNGFDHIVLTLRDPNSNETRRDLIDNIHAIVK